jgi:uncharacterized RDD family membrane protein YckC
LTAPADSAQRPAAEPARLGRRILAILYEALIVVAIAFLATLVFPGAATGRLSPMARHLLAGWVCVVVGVYFTWLWARGQTLPMRAWKLRVVGRDGRYIDARRAAWRYVVTLALVAPGLVGLLWLREHPDSWITWSVLGVTVASLGWSLFDRERRTLYDIASGTRLVRLTG